MRQAFFLKSIAMPLNAFSLIGGLAAAVIIPAGIFCVADWIGEPERDATRFPTAEIVMIAPGSFSHPQPGEFLKDGHPIAAPRILVNVGQPFEIMTYQVSAIEYGQCVDADACKPIRFLGLPALACSRRPTSRMVSPYRQTPKCSRDVGASARSCRIRARSRGW